MKTMTLDSQSSSPLLLREDLKDDPIEQFTCWLGQAARGPVSLPLAMSLATAGADGQPLVRTILMKYFDAHGFVFFTDLNTRKVRHMTENPRVSLLFPWLALNRQVIVTGRAERLGMLEAVKCFLLGQNGGMSALEAVEIQLEEIKQQFGAGMLPLGPSWGGYRVRPDSLEFWQGRGKPNEHDRFLYTRGEEGRWTIAPLE